MTRRPYCEGMRDHLVRCGEAAVEALGLDDDSTSPNEVRQAIAYLQATVRLARMLIQPGPDGPQLEGHRSFREALQCACREDLKTPDMETVAASMKAIDEGDTKPIQEIIDDLEGRDAPSQFRQGT